jgi:SulP family sulfate permease
MRHHLRPSWAGDLTAGIGGGLAYLPMIVVVAFIAFGSLGPQTAIALSIAIFGANIVAGIVLLALARCPILIGTPSGSASLVMAGLFGKLVAQGNVPDIGEAMAMTMAVGAIAGVVQLVLVRAGAAGLGPLAPYPVVSGLVNGTAALLLLSQLPILLAHPFEVVVAVATAAAMLAFPLRWVVPSVLPAIAMGMIVNAALGAAGITAGPPLSALPSPLVYPAMAAETASTLLSHAAQMPWRGILSAGVTVALLGLLETLATVGAMTDASIPTDGRRELNAVAVANLLVAAATVGPPVSATVGGALGMLRMGGKGRLAPISRLVTLALGGIFLGRYLPLVPQGALVGMVLAIGCRLIDREPVRLLWRALRHNTPHRLEIAGSAMISLTVVAVAVLAGLAVAVAVGAAACRLLFTAAMAGSAVRRVYDGATVLSRVRRSAEETAVLLEQRRSVAVLELAGPLFFGNVSPLAHALEEARTSGARHVVIDLSRIVRVDLSGARRLIAIVRQSRRHNAPKGLNPGGLNPGGMTVVLAPIRPGHLVTDYLAALGIEPGACFADLSDALAAAEAAILAEAGIVTPSFATAEQALLALGVAPEHALVLARHAETRDLAAGEVLCRAGEPADALYVLMRGQADVRLSGPRETAPDAPPEQMLLAHLSAGALVGERALFEAGTRAADVVCTAPSRVLVLSGAALAALIGEASPAALALVLAIIRHTSISMQLANAATQQMEI